MVISSINKWRGTIATIYNLYRYNLQFSSYEALSSSFDSAHEFLSNDVALHIPDTFDLWPTYHKSVLRVRRNGSPVDKEGDGGDRGAGGGRGEVVTPHGSASTFEPPKHLIAELPQEMMKKRKIAHRAISLPETPRCRVKDVSLLPIRTHYGIWLSHCRCCTAGCNSPALSLALKEARSSDALMQGCAWRVQLPESPRASPS